MGNSGGKGKDPSVKKRTKKVGKRDNRPVSDPGDQTASVSLEQHGLRRTGSEDLTGRDYYEVPVSFSMNPTQQQKEPPHAKGKKSASQKGSTAAHSSDISGTSALANDAVLAIYRKRLQMVLAVWPELSALNDIDFRSLRASALDALHTLYKTAYDEYEEAETIRKRKQDLADQAGVLEKQVHRHEDELRRKHNEIGALDREVQLLTGELRRRGIEPRLLERGLPPTQEEPPSDYDTIPAYLPPGEIAAAAAAVGAAGADSKSKESNEDPNSINKKKNKSMYIATPMLQAEGTKGIGVALQRTQSLKHTDVAAGAASHRDVRTPPKEMSRALEDLNQRVRSLQLELDEEKRRKISLQNKLDTMDARDPLATYATGAGPTPDTLRGRFDDLEGQALSRVVGSLYRVMGHVTHADVTRFICDAMMLSYNQAAEQYTRFQGSIHALLTSPVHPDSVNMDLNSSHNSGNNKRLSDKFEKGIGSRVGGSRLAQRTRVTSQLPNNLEEEVRDFIRLTSDTANIEYLAEGVCEGLRKSWPSCSSAITNQSFVEFLHQCCRLAWQLNTTSPPCYVTVDDPMRYDERLHDVLPVQAGNRPTIGAEIDYYAWPILYRKKHGAVLYRGRVALVMRL